MTREEKLAWARAIVEDTGEAHEVTEDGAPPKMLSAETR